MHRLVPNIEMAEPRGESAPDRDARHCCGPAMGGTRAKEEGTDSSTGKTDRSSGKRREGTANSYERGQQDDEPPPRDHPVLQLQRSHGNQALQRQLRSSTNHAKRGGNSSGDRHEQEAGRATEQVTRVSEPAVERACSNHTTAGGEREQCSDGKQVTRLRVVPETNVQRTPDLVLEFGDGTTTRVEIRTFTAAAKVKTGQEPTVSLGAATKLRSRPITNSELQGYIKDKAKTTSSRFSQLEAPMEGVPVGGRIAIGSHHKSVSPAVADAAMAELAPGLGPDVHSVTITTPSGTGAGRITLVYHRDGATFVRQP